jgi:hypothetical protein
MNFDDKIIAIFESDAFDLSWPDDDSDPNEPPLGKDLAEFLQARLQEQSIEADAPFDSETGWEFFVTIEGVQYSLLAQWAPMGEPESDVWVIQPQILQGCLKALFSRDQGQNPRDLQPLLKAIKPILNESNVFSDVRWLTRDEFSAVY